MIVIYPLLFSPSMSNPILLYSSILAITSFEFLSPGTIRGIPGGYIYAYSIEIFPQQQDHGNAHTLSGFCFPACSAFELENTRSSLGSPAEVNPILPFYESNVSSPSLNGRGFSSFSFLSITLKIVSFSFSKFRSIPLNGNPYSFYRLPSI